MKQIKNNILLTFLLTFSTILFSQQRGNKGNSSQKQGQNSQMTQPKVNPQNMAKIIMYDYDEVIKKIKIKKAPKQTVVAQAISKHNSKINEIKAFNYETFDNVKSFLTKKSEEAKLSRDYSTMRESQMKANEMMAPIRSKIMEQKKTLNTTLENELSEKQFKKWLKYQEGELNKLYPKASNSSQKQSSQGSRGSGSSQGRGMGRSRY